MKKIIDLKTSVEISKKLKAQKKTVVVTGGCFDILHIGHIRLFEKAKNLGDYLFVLLESDANVKKLKGKKRPINPQKERAEVLAALSFVDYVVRLPKMKNNEDYDNLIYALSPDIIATTKNDPQGIHNERQAKKINAKVAYVINRIKNRSTTGLAKIISQSFD